MACSVSACLARRASARPDNRFLRENRNAPALPRPATADRRQQRGLSAAPPARSQPALRPLRSGRGGGGFRLSNGTAAANNRPPGTAPNRASRQRRGGTETRFAREGSGTDKTTPRAKTTAERFSSTTAITRRRPYEHPLEYRPNRRLGASLCSSLPWYAGDVLAVARSAAPNQSRADADHLRFGQHHCRIVQPVDGEFPVFPQ